MPIYKSFDSFLARIPYLSFNNLNNYHEYNTIQKTQIQEAIYLATPVLYAELQKLLNGGIKNHY